MMLAVEKARGVYDLARETGSWCYWNDEPCPYTRDEDVAEWYAGFLAASRSDQQANNHLEITA